MDESKAKVYEQLCNSYRAIDDFRAKLLALLPLATGGGIFLLVGDGSGTAEKATFLPAIGIFGFVVTLGLFFYELHGILKCTYLIQSGAELEKQLGIEFGEDQFRKRPLGIFHFINEPFAASIVYPAVLAAWIFLAMDFEFGKDYSASSLFCEAPWATSVFIVGFFVGFIYDLWLVIPEYRARSGSDAQQANAVDA